MEKVNNNEGDLIENQVETQLEPDIIVEQTKTEIESENRVENRAETKSENRAETKSETRVENRAETKSETRVENRAETKSETQLKPRTEIHPIYHDYDTLVVAGGSAKSIVSIGALQYVYDNFLHHHFRYYIGTSAGAMICYLLIIGYTPIEIIVYICTNQLLEKMQNFNIFGLVQGFGACSFNIIQEQLEKMTILKIGYLPTLKDIKKKFNKELICVTYNLTESKTVFLNYEDHPNLPCITALRMTSNLPLIFENFKYGNSFFLDGGVSDNFAIDYADSIGNKILGINLVQEIKEFEPNMNTLEFIYKIMFIPIQQSIRYKVSRASTKCKIIQLKYDKLKFFDFNVRSQMKMEMFSSGYQQMAEEM